MEGSIGRPSSSDSNCESCASLRRNSTTESQLLFIVDCMDFLFIASHVIGQIDGFAEFLQIQVFIKGSITSSDDISVAVAHPHSRDQNSLRCRLRQSWGERRSVTRERRVSIGSSERKTWSATAAFCSKCINAVSIWCRSFTGTTQ
jgi:hypothetical protein